MLENSDKKSANQSPTKLSIAKTISIVGQLETLQIETFTQLKNLPLTCTKCDNKSTFTSEGVGGAATTNRSRPLQIKCKLCNKKTVFNNILSATLANLNMGYTVENVAMFRETVVYFTAAQKTLQDALEQAKKAATSRSRSHSPATRTNALAAFGFTVTPRSTGKTSETVDTPPTSLNSTQKRPAVSPADEPTAKKAAQVSDLGEKFEFGESTKRQSRADQPFTPRPYTQDSRKTTLLEDNRQLKLANLKLSHDVAALRAHMTNQANLCATFEARIHSLEAMIKKVYPLRAPPAKFAIATSNKFEHLADVADLDREFPPIQQGDTTTTGNPIQAPPGPPALAPANQRRSVPGFNPVQTSAGASSATHTSAQQVRIIPAAPEAADITSFSTIARRNAHKPQPPKAKPADRQLRKAAAACVLPQKAPLEFAKIRFKLANSLQIPDGSNVNMLLRAVTKFLKIRAPVMVSKIGNSIMEIYIIASDAERTRARIQEHNLEILEDIPTTAPTFAEGRTGSDFQVVQHKVVNRLSKLYQRARTQRLKACVLQGHTEIIQTAVRARVDAATPDATASAMNIDDPVESAAAAALGITIGEARAPSPSLSATAESSTALTTPDLPPLTQC